MLIAVIDAIVCIPGAYLLGLSVGAVFERMRPNSSRASPEPGHVTIVVPAHNEQDSIANTIASLKSLRDDDFSIHIIADNCTDETAKVAEEHGAVVWRRFHESKRSKGYALEWALPLIFRWAEETIGELRFVTIVDADATLSPNSIALARLEFAHGYDVLQSEYILSDADSLNSRIAVVGFAAMNVVRGLGRRFFNTTDFLKGNGMWFRRDVLVKLPWRAYSLAEDFEYSLELAKAGIPVRCLKGSQVTGLPARSDNGIKEQRVRWEAGRLSLVMQEWPAAFRRAVFKPSLLNLECLLELSTPPLAFLVAFYLALLATPFGPAALSALGGVALHVLVSPLIAKLPLSTYFALLGAPFYIGWKLLLMPKIWLRRKSKLWVRAQRVVVFFALTVPFLANGEPLAGGDSFALNPKVFCVGYGPWIEKDDSAKLEPVMVRWGGNTSSRYNFVQGNVWNAGKDWRFANIAKGEGALWRSFVLQKKAQGAQPVFSVPILGWLAKDGKSEGKVTNGKPEDTSVSLDDAAFKAWIAELKEQLGNKERIYPLDNEPFLWHETHADVVKAPVSADDFAARWIKYARLVREVDADAVLTGPGLWGWKDLQNLKPFLRKVVSEKDGNGKPLLNIVSAALYPQNVELQNSNADITGRKDKASKESKELAALRVESVRAFDDKRYRDPSWINKPVRYLPSIAEAIDEVTFERSLTAVAKPKIAIVEYNWGGAYSRSGAVAQALILQKMMANERVDHACTFTWPPPDSHAGKAFRALRRWLVGGSGISHFKVSKLQEILSNSILLTSESGTWIFAIAASQPLELPSEVSKRIERREVLSAEGRWVKVEAKGNKLPAYSIARLKLASKGR